MTCLYVLIVLRLEAYCREARSQFQVFVGLAAFELHSNLLQKLTFTKPRGTPTAHPILARG